MSGNEDPRDSNLETKLTLPPTWSVNTADGFSMSSMLLAGAVMVTRNRFLAWPALLLGLSSFLNQRPLRSRDTGPPWQTLISGISAVLISYMPMILIKETARQSQVPIDTTGSAL